MLRRWSRSFSLMTPLLRAFHYWAVLGRSGGADGASRAFLAVLVRKEPQSLSVPASRMAWAGPIRDAEEQGRDMWP